MPRKITCGGSFDYGSKAWCEQQLVVAIKMAMHGRPANPSPANPQPAVHRNPALAITAIMALGRFKGYIIDKKQVSSAKLDLSKLPPAQLQAVLSGHLNELDPAARQQIEAIASGEFEADFESLESSESQE